MSSSYHTKALNTEATNNIDKENTFISSNLSQEKKYSATRKYRKTNELLLKPSLAQYGQEPLSFQQVNIPPSFLNKGSMEPELAKKITAARAKKTLTFERSSFNGKPSELLLKERQQFLEKENKISAIEQRERFSYLEAGRLSLGEHKRGLEPSKVPYAEKEPIKLNPVLEPIAKEDKQDNDMIPEKPSMYDPETEKVSSVDSVDFIEQCNATIQDYVVDIMGELKMKDVKKIFLQD